MSRAYPMFGLRMPPELKERISREAKINGRSLNTEIVHRLELSLEGVTGGANNYTVKQTTESYSLEISDVERQMLTLFRRMSVEKQLALLSLFK